MLWTAITVAMSGPALAGDGYGSDLTTPLGYSLEAAAPSPDGERNVQQGVGIRVRRIRVPSVLLDELYTDGFDADWPWAEPRPEVSGTAIGIEYLVRGPHANGQFYAEYVDSAMSAGYWDRRDTSDPLDGTFLSPGRAFGLITAGAVASYEVHFLEPGQTAGVLGVSMLVGGGLGVGVLVGQLDAWGPDAFGTPGYDRFLAGQRPDAGFALPPVVPLVDLVAALRLTIGDRLLVTIDGGVHTAPYVGASIGVVY